jgi:L-ribulose-5-phosphate 3-epimerase
LDRRHFLKSAATVAAGFALPVGLSCENKKMEFKISLAEWSLHRMLYSGELDHLDFCILAREQFDLDAVEYVNSFFFDKAEDLDYLKEMKNRANDQGVYSLLIMCDNEGDLGDPNQKAREKAVENHFKWMEAAKFLGCHSIRVNAKSEGTYEDQIQLASEGLRTLTEYGEKIGINTIVENHGGLSSNGKWLVSVMKEVDHPMCGTLPDFGNFKIKDGEWYDRYTGVDELMPYAKAVSAKSHSFNWKGNEINTDYKKMINIVLSAGYNGYIGIEFEGSEVDEIEGIQLTKNLMEKVGGLSHVV